jgi:cobalt/nickel transport system ATP-binding protein
MNACPLSARSLEYTYPDGCAALHDIDITLDSGERVALIGENSAGKSTLLLLFVGCLTPQQGEIFVDKLPLTAKNLPAIRSRLGFVFQDANDQLFMPTVLEDAAFGPLSAGLLPKQAEENARAALELVRAGHLADRHPHNLSEGEKRLAALACVLSSRPGALLLDEPSSGLDPRARKHLIALLRSLPQTQLIATHDLDMALALCPRSIILHKGRIVAAGPTYDLLSDAATLDSAGLELPLSLSAVV